MYVYVYIYIYMKLNHFAVHQKLTQHCKSTILQLKKRSVNQETFQYLSGIFVQPVGYFVPEITLTAVAHYSILIFI